MAIVEISQAKSILVDINSTNNANVLPIYSTSHLVIGQEFIPKHKIVSFNVFLKNLKAFAKLQSLPEARLPDFALEDSATDKLYKVLDVEWQSPRVQLDLLLKNNLDGNWATIGNVSMLNPLGYPFRVYSLFDLLTDNLIFEMGGDTQIGVQIKDVGYGRLKNEDSVVIHGSYTEEIFLSYDAAPVIINVSGSNPASGSGAAVLPSTTIDNNAIIDNSFIVGN